MPVKERFRFIDRCTDGRLKRRVVRKEGETNMIRFGLRNHPQIFYKIT